MNFLMFLAKLCLYRLDPQANTVVHVATHFSDLCKNEQMNPKILVEGEPLIKKLQPKSHVK
jgi:hypothetical protein